VILDGLPGFYGARVDVSAGLVTVQFDGEVLSAEELALRIEAGGYGCPAFGSTVLLGG
jgi:hypothetical protein